MCISVYIMKPRTSQNDTDEFDLEGVEPENAELYIMNPRNILISKDDVIRIIRKYGINSDQIHNIDLFHRAMTHSTYLMRNPNYKSYKKKQHIVNYKDLVSIEDPSKIVPLQEHSYERLELLGDSVLHNVITDYLFHRYPTADEGFMSRLRAKIENKKSLARLCKEVGLNQYILISQRMEMFDARNSNDSIMEDSFEAFLGALYEEFGFESTKVFIVNIIETHFDMTEILQVETNYKDTLLQYYHKMRWPEPKYGECDTEGPAHRKWFTMYVTDSNDRRLSYGSGLSKKEGEQQAARKALIYYGLLEKNNYEDTILDKIDDVDDSSDDEEDLEELYKKVKKIC